VNGELCIAGVGVGRGYINQPELTQEKFIADPFFPGERMYRTGDLARWLPDGNIEFLGRLDHQVKIRGNRIELGEIENRLLQHPAIKSAVVIATYSGAAGENTAQDKYLCAYLVYEGETEITVFELRDYVAKELPDYMIPSYFVRLEGIPLTLNGKLDRSRLPAPSGNLNIGAVCEAPGNETEAKLVEFWREILGVNQVGIHDNFFELGGHSMKASILVARIYKELNVEIPLRQIFQTPTIAGIAEYLAKRGEGSSVQIPATAEQEQSGYYPTGYYPELAAQKRAQKLFYNLKDVQLFEIDQPGQKILRVNLQNEITTYLCHALPLCVVLADDRLVPWLYEHYINLFSVVDENGYLKLEFLEYRAAYKEVMHEIYLGYHLLKAESNIIDFMIDKINAGYYVIINVDEYYLSVKSRYQKEHFVHHSLVYGYDNAHQKLLAIGFNTEQIFGLLTFDYEPFRIAFEAGKKYYQETAPWAENNAVELLKLKAYPQEYPFALQKFLFQMDNYLAGTGDDAIIFTYMLDYQNVKYGIRIYDEVINSLKGLLKGQVTIDYRAVHLLSDHKKCLYTRLQYVITQYNLAGDVVKTIAEYRQIVEQVELIRKKFLQFNYRHEIDAADLQNPVKEAIVTLTLIKEKEQLILGKVSRQLHAVITG
jgi:acyl carrier protein